MKKGTTLSNDQIQELINAGKPPAGMDLTVLLNSGTPYYCWGCKHFWREDMSMFTPEARIMVPIKPGDIKRPCPKCRKPVYPLAFPKHQGV